MGGLLSDPAARENAVYMLREARVVFEAQGKQPSAILCSPEFYDEYVVLVHALAERTATPLAGPVEGPYFFSGLPFRVDQEMEGFRFA